MGYFSTVILLQDIKKKRMIDVIIETLKIEIIKALTQFEILRADGIHKLHDEITFIDMLNRTIPEKIIPMTDIVHTTQNNQTKEFFDEIDDLAKNTVTNLLVLIMVRLAVFMRGRVKGGYNLFTVEFLETINVLSQTQEDTENIHNRISVSWRRLSDDEKHDYSERASNMEKNTHTSFPYNPPIVTKLTVHNWQRKKEIQCEIEKILVNGINQIVQIIKRPKKLNKMLQAEIIYKPGSGKGFKESKERFNHAKVSVMGNDDRDTS